MDLLPTDEQLEIASSVRSMLDKELALDPSRDGTASVVDRAMWARCAELGWFGLGLPEELGGVGYGLPEETLLFEQVGRTNAAGPFLATVLGARLAAEAGRADLAAEVLSGTAVVGLAEPFADDHQVLWAEDADLLLVADGSRFRLIRADAGTLTPVAPLDPQVPVARGPISGADEAVAADGADLAARGSVLVAATAAGIAAATCEQSVQYALDREQFGRPIGMFQAVKHRCADMAVQAEAAVQQTRLAAIAVERGDADAAFQAHAARIVAVRAAIANSQVNVQNHGGIGFTWEHTAHRFVVRARVLERLAGPTTTHLADLLGAPAPL